MSNSDLTPCTDPPCPYCGCRQSEVISARTRWGRPRRNRRCGHCCGRWWEAVPAARAEQEAIPKRQPGDAVIYVPTRCPECRSKNVRITSTRKHGVRQHKCKDCGETFQSVEREM